MVEFQKQLGSRHLECHSPVCYPGILFNIVICHLKWSLHMLFGGQRCRQLVTFTVDGADVDNKEIGNE